MHIIEPCTQIQAISVDIGSGKGRVARCFKVYFRAVEAFVQQPSLKAKPQVSARQLEATGILNGQPLMLEEPDFLVHKLHTGPLITPHDIER